jgi:hypothetical protein
VHEAGGTSAQALGFAAASALALLKAGVEAGLPLDSAARGLWLGLTVDAEYFDALATVRALRLIWAGLTRPPYFGGFSWYYGNPTRAGSLSRDTADEVGQMLCDANAASVTHRYRQTGLIRTEYRYRTPRHTAWSVPELLKALGCFEYQACEVPDWPASEAHAFCRALQDLLIHRLPGYSEGPWAISATDVPAVGQ